MSAASHNPAIARLIEKQMRNWELARAQRLSELPEEKPEVGDFLCLSRIHQAQCLR